MSFFDNFLANMPAEMVTPTPGNIRPGGFPTGPSLFNEQSLGMLGMDSNFGGYVGPTSALANQAMPSQLPMPGWQHQQGLMSEYIPPVDTGAGNVDLEQLYQLGLVDLNPYYNPDSPVSQPFGTFTQSNEQYIGPGSFGPWWVDPQIMDGGGE